MDRKAAEGSVQTWAEAIGYDIPIQKPDTTVVESRIEQKIAQPNPEIEFTAKSNIETPKIQQPSHQVQSNNFNGFMIFLAFIILVFIIHTLIIGSSLDHQSSVSSTPSHSMKTYPTPPTQVYTTKPTVATSNST